MGYILAKTNAIVKISKCADLAHSQRFSCAQYSRLVDTVYRPPVCNSACSVQATCSDNGEVE